MGILPVLQVQRLQERLQTAEAAAALAARDGSSTGAPELQQARAEADAQRQRCDEMQQVCGLATLPNFSAVCNGLMVRAN
jgi:uncharacterized membrane protein